MNENVLREIISQGITPQVCIEEAVPKKGKPSRTMPVATVFIVKVRLTDSDKTSIIESSRGGAREWKSLDRLAKWLLKCGISKYEIAHGGINHSPDLSLAFVDKE